MVVVVLLLLLLLLLAAIVAVVVVVGVGAVLRVLPKGPSRTENTTTIEKIVNYYAVVFFYYAP